MCHYDQLTFPEPAVIVAIVFAPLVVVEPVKPAPKVIVPLLVANLRTTTPLPPEPGVSLLLLPAPRLLKVNFTQHNAHSLRFLLLWEVGLHLLQWQETHG